MSRTTSIAGVRPLGWLARVRAQRNCLADGSRALRLWGLTGANHGAGQGARDEHIIASTKNLADFFSFFSSERTGNGMLVHRRHSVPPGLIGLLVCLGERNNKTNPMPT